MPLEYDLSDAAEHVGRRHREHVVLTAFAVDLEQVNVIQSVGVQNLLQRVTGEGSLLCGRIVCIPVAADVHLPPDDQDVCDHLRPCTHPLVHGDHTVGQVRV